MAFSIFNRAQFIGRDTADVNGVVGVDAALDYPLFFVLPNELKEIGASPADLAQLFKNRKQVEKGVICHPSSPSAGTNRCCYSVSPVLP